MTAEKTPLSARWTAYLPHILMAVSAIVHFIQGHASESGFGWSHWLAIGLGAAAAAHAAWTAKPAIGDGK